MGSAGIEEILDFWFGELSPKDWFRKDEAVDATIASRFGTTYCRPFRQRANRELRPRNRDLR